MNRFIRNSKTLLLTILNTPVKPQLIVPLVMTSLLLLSGTRSWSQCSIELGGRYHVSVNSNETYSTFDCQGVVDMITSIEGSGNYVVSQEGPNVVIHWGSTPGEYHIYSNNCNPDYCGYRDFTVLVLPVETLFTVGGGGNFCSGGSKLITLSGSQTDLSYSLYRNGIYYSDQYSGTLGGPLTWTVNQPGTYTVASFGGYGSLEFDFACNCAPDGPINPYMMNGSAIVTTSSTPTPAFTQSPGASALTNTNVTYSTAAGQSNYVWNIPGTLNTDYSITSGSTGTGSNTVTLKWLTTGSKTVKVGYTSNGCASTTPASVTTIVNLSIPSTPSVLTASPASPAQINLTWTDNSNNETGFQIERSTISGSGFTLVATTAANSTSYNNTGLTEGTPYFYRVRAINTVGNSSYTSEGTAITPIIPPSMLIATLNPSTQINLTWIDNSASETGFQIERSIAGGNFVVIGTTSPNVTTYTDANVQEELHYYYRICAVKPGGNSVYTPVTEVNTPSTPPIAPSSLVATPASSTQINLTWTDNSNNETGFQVEESSTPGSGFIAIATTSPNVTSYTSQGLLVNTPYYYRVRSINTTYNSAYTSEATTSTLTVIKSVLTNLAFQYKYDERKRIIGKKAPGTDWVYMVYDKRDRLVMSQDGEQRRANKWAFIKYDAFNRPIITGIYTHTSPADQTVMSGLISTVNFFETYTGDAANHGYSNTVFQSTNFPGSFDALTITYYDNYNFKTLIGDPSYNYKADEFTEQYRYDGAGSSFLRVIGQVTGSKTRILDQETFLWNVNYFDDKYRTVQNLATNVRGGVDRTTNVYDFVGKVLKTKTVHNVNLSPQTVSQVFSYDHVGRLEYVKHSVNGSADIVLVKNEYNELGQLVDKKLHSEDNGSTFKQSVDYRYNIRGWLTSINNAQLTDDHTTTNTNDDANDLFGMNFSYNDVISGLNNNPLYNGNISAIKWSNNLGLGDIKEQAYKYTYDPMNRLTAAMHHDKTTSWGTSTSFHENNLSYDLNGNIQSLSRKGAQGLVMDELAYHYNGNQLLWVNDNGDKTKGFIDGNVTGNDYSYDMKGNLLVDKNKGITAITYNHLNLPERATKTNGDYIKFIYDANGKKLSELVYNSVSVLKKKTDFVDEFFYENDTLKYISHEEGRIVMPPLAIGAQPEYQYHFKDQVGNVRMTFTTKTLQQSLTATFETTAQNTETGKFSNYPTGAYINTLPTNATSGTNSEYLNGGYKGQIGLAKSFSVMPGDQLQIQAYGKYNTPSGTGTNMTGIAAAMLSAFNLAPPVAGEVGTASSALNAWGGVVSGGYATTGDPKVFVTIILFDRDYNALDVSYKQLKDGVMSTSYTVRQPGYAYLYVSNENPTFVDVYVDDVTMSLTPSPVVQMDEYYPFGLSYNSSTRENSVPNKIKFQGQEHVDDLGLNWDSFKWRNHQPDIGRFFNVDPLAEKYYYNSPYAFSENRVVNGRELEGLEWVSTIDNQGNTNIKVNTNFSFQVDPSLLPKGTTSADYQTAISSSFNNTLQASSGGRVFGEVTFNGGDEATLGRVVPSLNIYGNKPDPGSKISIGGLTTFQHSGVNIYKNNGSIKTPSEVAEDATHELLHTVRVEHPFEKTQGADTKLIHQGPNSYSTTSTTDSKIAYNVMNYSMISIDGQKLGSLWKTQRPIYLTKDQLKLVQREIKLQMQGAGTEGKNFFNYWLNAPGTDVKKNK